MKIRKEIIIILCLIICIILSLNAVSAATNDLNKANVTDNSNLLSLPSNNNNNVLGSGGQSFTELNETINGGTQSVIDLKNNYTFTDRDTDFVNGIRINRPLTINGNGFAIDGANKARIFDIYALVTLNNIVFINGNSSTNGGAIDVENAVASRIELCTFINNSAKDSGGAIYLNDMAHNTVVTDCKFINNTAEINGGAIEWHKNSENGLVTNSEFINNIAGRSGGAIYWNGYNGTVRNSKFNGNKALGINNATDSYGKITYGGDGGAIIWIGALGDVENCTFRDNNASKRGGAAFLEGGTNIDCDDTTFDNCTFISNYAGTNGGAVDWHEGASNGNVINCVFEFNAANANGGAIYWRGHNGEIINSNFTSNTARGLNLGTYNNTGDGGAIFWAGVNGTLTNDRFISNKAVKNINNNTSGRGGAMYLGSCEHGNRNITITGSYFKDNNAGTNGGALDWYAGAHDGLVDDCTFIHNIANRSGGAIFWNGHNGTILFSKFYDNHALGITNATSVRGDVTYGGDGGAVMWSGADGYALHSNFVNNTAAKRGGAVFLQSAATETSDNTFFEYSYFANNVAGTNGGAIDWNEGAKHGKVLNAVFINNTAKRNGGAIFWHGENGTVKNSKFINNRATGEAWEYNLTINMGDKIIVGENGTLTLGNIVVLQQSSLPIDSSISDYIDKLVVLNYTYDNVLRFESYVVVNGTTTEYTWKMLDETSIRVSQSIISPVDWAIDQYFGGDGGTILWSGDIGLVENCTFTDSNSARRGGGAYMTGSDNVTYKDCYFEKCTSGTNGGGVDWLAGANYGKILNCTFNNTRAARSAGAIYYDGWYGRMENVTIINTQSWGGALKISDDRRVNYAGWDSSHWDTNTTGGDAGAIMYTGSNIYVYNVTFTNCNGSGRGGAVFLQDNYNVTFDSCKFENNIAAGTANNTYYDDKDISTGINEWLTGWGGAVAFDVNAHDATIKNSKFLNNIAIRTGGAISFAKGAENNKVLNSTFDNNTAHRSGGAIYWNGLNGTIHDSIFTNNRAVGDKWQYSLIVDMGNHADVQPDGTVILGNIVVLQTNTLPTSPDTYKDRLVVLNSTQGKIAHFESWVVTEDTVGYKWKKLDEINITVSESVISPVDWAIDQYFGGDGGTILWSGSVGYVENCTFIESNSARRGGGAYMTGCDNVTYESCKFINCTSGTNGGGVDWLAGANYGKIYNCIFNNTRAARSAGAIYYDGWYGDMKNITIINTQSWGGALNTSRDGRVNYAGWDSSHWDTNTTGGDAGAIMFTGSCEYVYNVTFINCNGSGRGGAVFLQDNFNVTFDTCKFINNFAAGTANNTYNDDKDISSGTNAWLTGYGGAIAFDVNAHLGIIKKSQFINNTAVRIGGAISFGKGSFDAIISDSTFDDNTAYRSGGAISWDGTNGTMTNCNFTNNAALGTDISTLFLDLKDLNQIEYGTSLPDKSSFGLNKVFVLIQYNGDQKANYTMYSINPDNDEWTILEFTTETGPSPIDWVTDEYFGGDGGTIFWTGDNGTVDNCRFIDSNSARRGGGAYMTGSDNIVFKNSYFENCTSGTNGGGLDWLAGANYGRVINCTFNNTRAARSAGAIYYDGDYGRIENITVINTRSYGGTLKHSTYGRDNVIYARWDASHWDTNTTGGDAGAIMFTGDHEYVYNATFINTTSQGRGGAVFLQDNSNITFDSCKFIGDEALGIATNTWKDYTKDRDDHYSDTTLDYKLTGHGGAIAFDVGAHDVVIKKSEFI